MSENITVGLRSSPVGTKQEKFEINFQDNATDDPEGTSLHFLHMNLEQAKFVLLQLELLVLLDAAAEDMK